MSSKNKKCYATLGDLPHYGPLKKFLILIGQYPQQSNYSRISIYMLHLGTYITLLIPLFIELITSLRNHDLDRVLEALPVIGTDLITVMKLSNLNFNRKKFRMLYNLVINEWESLKFKDEIKTLDEVTRNGSNIAFLYRATLLGFLVLFSFLPLMPLFLDIVLPLNETRQKQQVFKLNYLVDGDTYFYPIYFHSVLASVLAVTVIVTADSMYMLVTHHACGLFAMCGYQIKEMSESFDENGGNTDKEKIIYQKFKDCALIHKRGIQFYEHINDINELSFLIQIGINMLAISLTAVQIVMNLNNIREAFRIGLFLVAQQFHLFFNSLPGQSLVDHSLQLLDDLYSSKWYRAPVRMQRVIYMMQIRSGVPCTLTAGGLYDMNIENFGMIFKTCMSYFTMLLSLRE